MKIGQILKFYQVVVRMISRVNNEHNMFEMPGLVRVDRYKNKIHVGYY